MDTGSPEYPSTELRQTQLYLYHEQLGHLIETHLRQYISGQLSEQDYEQRMQAIRVDRQRIEAFMA